jgi:4-amino-4-deoxy-L-arabinose transferase-like glycosyltransferase
MGFIAGVFLFAVAALNCYILVRLFKPDSLIDTILLVFVLFWSTTLLTGYAISFAGGFGSLLWWTLAQLILLLVLTGPAISLRGSTPPLMRTHTARLRPILADTLSGLSLEEKLVLYPPALTLLVIGLCNLALLLWVAPHTWDSMTYHLPRMAYYIQHGDLAFFDASYWAQVVHPKNATIMVAFSYLTSGRNENLTQIVQFSSYWVSAAAVYGISRAIGNSRPAGILSALTFALLINGLMESTTAQNDLLLAALSATALYFLFRATQTRSLRLLIPSALALGIALGIKGSALLIVPSLVLVGIYLFRRWDPRDVRQGRRPLFLFITLLVVSICLFALPSGYLDNVAIFGNPFGPETVRHEHSFEGRPADEILIEGSKNTLRYGLDFLSLDGFPHSPFIARCQLFARSVIVSGLQGAGIDLIDDRGTRVQFSVSRLPSGHEDFSYWGILGFSLVWIMVLLQFGGIQQYGGGRILAGAALLFFLVQCFAGPYDPWRGRYFTACAVFASPIVGYSLNWVRTKRGWYFLTVVLVLGCLSALSAVFLRPIDLELTPWVREQSAPSLLKRSRLQQLTTNNRLVYEPLARFEEIVPKDARVAVCMGPNAYEYPLFGEGLTRRLSPVSGFRDGVKPVPDGVEYLLFSPDFIVPGAGDEHLGNRWYLRRLAPASGVQSQKE